jgi:hypothetical protein
MDVQGALIWLALLGVTICTPLVFWNQAMTAIRRWQRKHRISTGHSTSNFFRLGQPATTFAAADGGTSVAPILNRVGVHHDPGPELVEAKDVTQDKPLSPNAIVYYNNTLMKPDNITDELWDFLPPWWKERAVAGEVLPAWWFGLLKKIVPPDGSTEKAAHAFVLAGSGGGKTTTTRALMADVTWLLQKYGGQAVVLDPHASPDWGMEAVGYGHDMLAIRIAMEYILHILNLRIEEYGRGKKNFTRLVVCVDEWRVLRTAFRKDQFALQFLARLINEGRKFGIVFLFQNQSALVEATGVKGESDLYKSMVFLRLQEKATEVKRKYFALHPTPWPCVLTRTDGVHLAVDRSFMPWLFTQPVTSSVALHIPNLPPRLTAQDIEADWKKRQAELMEEVAERTKATNDAEPVRNKLELLPHSSPSSGSSEPVRTVRTVREVLTPVQIAQYSAMILENLRTQTISDSDMIKKCPRFNADYYSTPGGHKEFYYELKAGLMTVIEKEKPA